MKILEHLERFPCHVLSAALVPWFFRREGAGPLGLARVFWGLTGLYTFLPLSSDIVLYVSDAGYFTWADLASHTRNHHLFTIFSSTAGPGIVLFFYSLVVLSFALVTVGIFTRPAILIALVLTNSFQERMFLILGGGDNVLRLMGFILLISPCHAAWSWQSLKKRLQSFSEDGKDVPTSDRTVPVYPRLLLLWQLLVIYVSSGWLKLLGSLWISGDAVFYALHHPHFQRFSDVTIGVFDPLLPFINFLVLIFLLSWLLLPLQFFLKHLSFGTWRMFIEAIPLRQVLLLSAFVFHVLIFLVMDVSTFSIAMIAMIVGATSLDDLSELTRWGNRLWKKRWGTKKMKILYDGHCGLCQRAMLILLFLDSYKRLQFLNFHKAHIREREAKGISLRALDEAMHVMHPSGTLEKGFDGFRLLCWNIPAFFVLVPILYIPGFPPLGRLVYREIAKRRRLCSKGACRHR